VLPSGFIHFPAKVLKTVPDIRKNVEVALDAEVECCVFTEPTVPQGDPNGRRPTCPDHGPARHNPIPQNAGPTGQHPFPDHGSIDHNPIPPRTAPIRVGPPPHRHPYHLSDLCQGMLQSSPFRFPCFFFCKGLQPKQGTPTPTNFCFARDSNPDQAAPLTASMTSDSVHVEVVGCALPDCQVIHRRTDCNTELPKHEWLCQAFLPDSK